MTSNYTEKLERYLQDSEFQRSNTSSMSSVKKSQASQELWFSRDNKPSALLNSLSKSATKKSPTAAKTNQYRIDPPSLSISNFHSPSALHDITNNKRNQPDGQAKNSRLLAGLTSESVSFTSDCTVDLAQTSARKQYQSSSSASKPNSKQFVKENKPYNNLLSGSSPSQGKPQQASVLFQKKLTPTVDYPRVDTYNIEDFLPEQTYLKVDPYGFDLGSSLTATPKEYMNYNSNFASHDPNFTRILANMTKEMHMTVDNTVEYSTGSYSNPNFFASLNGNHTATQKKPQNNLNNLNNKALTTNNNINVIVDNSMMEEQDSSTLNQIEQSSVAHFGSRQAAKGMIDERSREQIQDFVKHNLTQAERPKDTTSNEYADFLSRILIKLIENLPMLHQNQTPTETKDTSPASAKQATPFQAKSKAVQKTRLQIQHLEAINYIPERRYQNERGQAFDLDMFGGASHSLGQGKSDSTHREAKKESESYSEVGFTEKPPISHKNSGRQAQAQTQSRNHQFNNKTHETSIPDIDSQDDLSDSSAEAEDTHQPKKTTNERKSQKSHTSSKQRDTLLSNTLDSDYDFELPPKRLTDRSRSNHRQTTESTIASRFSFKNSKDQNQQPTGLTGSTFDSRRMSLDPAQSRSTLEKNFTARDYLSSAKGGLQPSIDTTARFNSSNTTSSRDRGTFGTTNGRSVTPVDGRGRSRKDTYPEFTSNTHSSTDRKARESVPSKRSASTKPDTVPTITKRAVYINENNEVVFTENPPSETNTMRSQPDSKDQDQPFFASERSSRDAFSRDNRRKLSPDFDHSKESSKYSFSRSGNDEWSPSRVQLEYSVSNSHVSRMNSIMMESQSRIDPRSGRLPVEDDRKRGREPYPTDVYDTMKTSLMSSVETERGRALETESKPVGWKPVRFSSREKIDEFLNNY